MIVRKSAPVSLPVALLPISPSMQLEPITLSSTIITDNHTDGESPTELHLLRTRVAELEARLASYPALEAALGQSTARFRGAFDYAAIGMALVAPDGRWLEVNQAVCDLLGYTAAELLTTTFQAITHPDDLESDLASVQQMLAGTISSYQMEKRYIHKQGSILWVLLSMSLVWHETGQPAYFIAQIQDITGRKAIEVALQESEARYRTVLMALDSGIVLQHADGSIQAFNASVERILGLSAAQLQGRTSMDPRWQAIHEDGSPFPGETHPAMVTLRTGQPCDNVIMGVHKPDRTLTWIKIGTRPLFHPGEAFPYAVVASFTDITERKRLEEELREREAQFRLLMTHSLDAVLLTAPDGQIFAANPAATVMFGYTEEELCAGGRDLILDTTDLQLASVVAERLSTGVFRGELNHRRRDGTIFPAELSSALFYDHSGKLRTSVVIRDISERKRAEQALLESEERFARVFHASPIGICITTVADGRMVDMNESCEHILGYTRSELIGRKITKLRLWQQSDERSDMFRAIREQGFYRNWGAQFINKAGEVRDTFISVERIEVRGEPCLLTMAHDITEWRQLEREHEWLISRLNQSLERTDVLYHVAALLNRPHETQEVLQTVVESAAALLGANRTILISVDMATHQILQRLEGGPGRIGDSTITFEELNEGLSGVALRERRAVLSVNGAVDEHETEAVRLRRVREQAGSILVVPLEAQTILLGTLTAINTPDEPDFTESDMALMTILANQAASAIERAHLLNELRYQATTDGLTQLLNRRAWLDHGERAVAAAQRSNHPLSVMLMDADHFKRINDTYGHDVGDLVLKTIAECCRQAVRRSDVVGRYGGEEFVILLPETDALAASEIAERVRSFVAAEQIRIPQGDVSVTLSIGVATTQSEAIHLSTLLSQADRALYSAKQAGRNCVRTVSC